MTNYINKHSEVHTNWEGAVALKFDMARLWLSHAAILNFSATASFVIVPENMTKVIGEIVLFSLPYTF